MKNNRGSNIMNAGMPGRTAGNESFRKGVGRSAYKLKKTAILAALVSLLAVSASCGLFPEEEEALPPPVKSAPVVEYRTVPARKGTLVKSLDNLTAKFMSPVLADVYFTDSGLRFKGYTVKQGDTVMAGAVLAEADTSGLENSISQQEITLRKLELTYSQQKASNADEFTLMKSQIDIESARDTLEKLKSGLENTKLLAPISGQITFLDTGLKEASSITANKVYIRMADLSQLMLQYSGTNTNDLKLGMKTSVIYNHQKYEGEVVIQTYEGEVVMTPREVPSDGDNASKSIVLIKVYGIKDLVLALNDSASFSVVLDQREDVIITYKNYVSRTGGVNTVQVLQDGIKVQRTVELGMETTSEVEIISGLEEGELVIVP